MVSIKNLIDLSVFDDLLLPKLKSVSICYRSNENSFNERRSESQIFKTFVQNHKKSLKSLVFWVFYDINIIRIEENEQNFISKEMSAFTNLESLKIYLNDRISFAFGQYLKTVGVECNKIVKLDIILDETNPSLNEIIFKSLGFLKI